VIGVDESAARLGGKPRQQPPRLRQIVVISRRMSIDVNRP
jgi:hypothetical protein